MPGQRRAGKPSLLACVLVLAASMPLLSQAKDTAQRHTAVKLPAQASQSASWRGDWRMRWLPGTDAEDAASMQTFQLRPSGQAWVSRTAGASGADDGPLLRAMPATDYAELGWAKLYAAGRLKCLSEGMILVCRTQPGATVPFFAAQGGTLTTQSGLFGAMHQGGFELIPLD